MVAWKQIVGVATTLFGTAAVAKAFKTVSCANDTVVEPVTKLPFQQQQGSFRLLGVGARSEAVLNLSCSSLRAGSITSHTSASSGVADHDAQVVLPFSVRCRIKYGLFPVYAVGLYLDQTDVANSNGPILSSVAQGQVDARLQLLFYRNVDHNTMIEALRDSVAPRMTTMADDELTKLTSALEDISNGGAFAAGSELTFDWNTRKSLLVLSKDKGLPTTITAEHVAPALFKVYLDEHAVAPDAKKSFEANAKLWEVERGENG
jgi:hypothetical protein